jgi:hypothetical protein
VRAPDARGSLRAAKASFHVNAHPDAQEVPVRNLVAVLAAAVALAIPAGALAAANPSGSGPPSQSCQDIEAAGGTTPGQSASSPGSPFNEPGINSPNGGTGGQNYSESSQYDVACFQVSQPPK